MIGKVEGNPCVKCSSTVRYANDGKCVKCCCSHSEIQVLRRAKASSKAIKPITKTKVKTIYLDGKRAGNSDKNPYSYNEKIGSYCAWQAGFNDRRATVNH